jgi:predicted nucleotidyltransferase
LTRRDAADDNRGIMTPECGKATDDEIAGIRGAVASAIEGFDPRIAIVYLYGSRATGTANEESDFDFAVAAKRLLDIRERGELADKFSEELVAAKLVADVPEVDTVDMRRIPLTLAAQVLEYGIVVFGEDDPERGFLETRLMSEYAALNEERREVLEAIMERGSVHARS